MLTIYGVSIILCFIKISLYPKHFVTLKCFSTVLHQMHGFVNRALLKKQHRLTMLDDFGQCLMKILITVKIGLRSAY